MDISVPSNFERLMFEVSGRDGDTVRRTYEQYRQSNAAILPDSVRGPLGCTGFDAEMIDNQETLAEMRAFRDGTGQLICPHTAVGTAAARRLGPADACTVILSTAHAAKFPETVLEATGEDAPLPSRCEELKSRGEVFDRLPNDLKAIQDFIREKMVAEA